MIEKLQLRVQPAIAADDMQLRVAASTVMGIDVNRIKRLDLLRRSIDARQRQVIVNLTVNVHIDMVNDTFSRYEPIFYPDVNDKPEIIVVGAGPAGLFAALELIESGLKPIVIERGKDVDARRRDMAAISRNGDVNPDSNYCFGEGGAGAFSDGKLYTRSTKRGPVEKVLQIFHAHGAQDAVLIDAHPHIGTDRLPVIIKAMRHTIIEHGGEVHFNTRVSDLIFEDERSVAGVATADGREFRGPVLLATGHSARDVYSMLERRKVPMEAKGIAIGVRLEHPQELIDRIQYHSPKGRGKWLPAAEYSMLTRVDGRAVYSFCMCPGGVIIPAASEPGQLVVNGMSPSNRGTRWANSGMVVEILPEDLPEYDKYGSLKMMHFQQDVETRFFKAAGNTQCAPAQRMTDFVASRLSTSLPDTSYAPGIQPGRIDKLLPEFVAIRLQKGFEEFGRKARGFLTSEAVLIGDETRTSAPVRVPRDKESRCHVAVRGLYPVGEGAGYAGGIVSAAIDGINTAREIARAYLP
ncbi:MAG: FAD-binding protein [Muribaculaceae bacterium]|nr:FAD-binding protein [Muribaculaceae bacterium]